MTNIKKNPNVKHFTAVNCAAVLCTLLHWGVLQCTVLQCNVCISLLHCCIALQCGGFTPHAGAALDCTGIIGYHLKKLVEN